MMAEMRFQPGDQVRVRRAFPPGHVRTPYFIRGCAGSIAGVLGNFANPEELAYGRPGTPRLTLYRVAFKQREVWPDYDGPAADTIVVDLYETWLEPTS